MIDFDAFYPHVMPSAPGCPEPTVINALRQAAQRFCETTRAWRCNDTFDVTMDTCAFVCVPDGAELFEIEAVTFDGRPIDPISVAELDRLMPRWRDQTEAAQPRYYTQLDFDTIRLAPAGEGTVQVWAFLKPSEDADQLPDFLGAKFARAIASGALADILLLPGQPFFNPDLASVHAARFQSVLDRNFNLNLRGQQRAPTRTRAQFL
ncbi:phage adaptor protein [Bradyrhizobium elkanii]|uniref:phage adaptor protein n=1 Tax=Bradyrhizobium elkanii TaxID=29448 RepID=UPI00351176E5